MSPTGVAFGWQDWQIGLEAHLTSAPTFTQPFGFVQGRHKWPLFRRSICNRRTAESGCSYIIVPQFLESKDNAEWEDNSGKLAVLLMRR